MNAEQVAWAEMVMLSVQTVVLAMTGCLVWRYTKATEKYTDETAACVRKRFGRTSYPYVR